jgi:hypothetical protein
MQDRIELERINKMLAHALEQMIERYIRLVNSGDCGDWDPEMDDEVINSRSALALALAKGGE